MSTSTLITDSERTFAYTALTWLLGQPDAANGVLADLASRPDHVISDVSSAFYGVAGHYGGMRIQGEDYLYVAQEDACIRLDVVRRIMSLHVGANSLAASS